MDCIVHGILQARILEWVAFPFSRGSSQPRGRTQVSRIAGTFFTSWATRETQEYWSGYLSLLQWIFLTQESNRGLLHCRRILYQRAMSYWKLLKATCCIIHFLAQGSTHRRSYDPTGNIHFLHTQSSIHSYSQVPLRLKKLHIYMYTREGNGNPLQCSCLENPRDRGAWWAAIYGVAQSRTRLKRLSSIYVHTHTRIWMTVFPAKPTIKEVVTVHAYMLDLEVQTIITKVSLFLENVFEVESTVQGWLPVLQQSFLLSIPSQGLRFHWPSLETTSPLGEIRMYPLDQVFKLHDHLFGNSNDFILQEVVGREQQYWWFWSKIIHFSIKPIWNTIWVV